MDQIKSLVRRAWALVGHVDDVLGRFKMLLLLLGGLSVIVAAVGVLQFALFSAGVLAIAFGLVLWRAGSTSRKGGARLTAEGTVYKPKPGPSYEVVGIQDDRALRISILCNSEPSTEDGTVVVTSPEQVDYITPCKLADMFVFPNEFEDVSHRPAPPLRTGLYRLAAENCRFTMTPTEDGGVSTQRVDRQVLARGEVEVRREPNRPGWRGEAHESSASMSTGRGVFLRLNGPDSEGAENIRCVVRRGGDVFEAGKDLWGGDLASDCHFPSQFASATLEPGRHVVRWYGELGDPFDPQEGLLAELEFAVGEDRELFLW